jgi:hypothetical protein
MADNFDVKDAASVTHTIRAFDVGAGILAYAMVPIDSSGAQIMGEKSKASCLPVALPTNQALLGRGIDTVSDSFTRPADTTPYTMADLVANSTVAGSVVPLTFASATRYATGAGRIPRARLFKSDPTLTNARFRLHVFTATPTGIANGDNAAFSVNGTGYIGCFLIQVDRAFVNGAYGDGVPVDTDSNHAPIRFKLSSGSSLFGLLEARDAYTPISGEVFTATLEIEQT